MNCRIRITCQRCNYEFFAYLHRDMHHSRALDCPKCYTEMDSQMKVDVMRVAGEVSDLNQEFVKHNLGAQEPLFLVSFDGIQGPT